MQAVTPMARANCEFFQHLVAFYANCAKLTFLRHCDGDVSLALESESEHSHEEEGEHDHSESSNASESTPASEITEVSDCHGHGDELFCVAGGDEWEVSTEVNVDDAPSSYSGCHAHGEDAL